MKIKADVLGVEQAMDFNTMEQSAFVVLTILGATLRVAISEEQMEALTIAALRFREGEQEEQGEEKEDHSGSFIDTREASETETAYREQEEIEERDFSVATELTPHGQSEDGVLELFAPTTEESEKIAELRARPQLARHQPAPVEHSPGLPRMPGFGGASDDEGIPQG